VWSKKSAGGKTKAGAGFPADVSEESRSEIVLKPVEGRSGSEFALQE